MAKKKILIPGPKNSSVEDLITRFGYSIVTDERPDCLVLTGGGDVNPRLYYEKPHAANSAPNIERDHTELSAILAARAHGIPVAGICRGMQLIHVSVGGRLEQHVEGHRSTVHMLGRKFLYQDDLRASMNDRWSGVRTNSLHHQAVPLVEASQNYEFVMVSAPNNQAHNLPETVEVIYDHKMRLGGVQYHPEYTSASSESVSIFREIIELLTN